MDIGCQCKGTLSMCHRECLVDWANAQQSAVCEICHTEYPGIVARPVVRNHRHQRRTISVAVFLYFMYSLNEEN